MALFLHIHLIIKDTIDRKHRKHTLLISCKTPSIMTLGIFKALRIFHADGKVFIFLGLQKKPYLDSFLIYET